MVTEPNTNNTHTSTMGQGQPAPATANNPEPMQNPTHPRNHLSRSNFHRVVMREQKSKRKSPSHENKNNKKKKEANIDSFEPFLNTQSQSHNMTGGNRLIIKTEIHLPQTISTSEKKSTSDQKKNKSSSDGSDSHNNHNIDLRRFILQTQCHVPRRPRTPYVPRRPDDTDEPKTTKAAREFCGSFCYYTRNHMHNKTKVKSSTINSVDQSSKFFCTICLDFKTEPEMFGTSGECNHSFCTECISMHVATQIQQNILKVNCPDPNCWVELEPQYFQPILPREVVDRWEAARFESSIASGQKTYCPFKDCSVLLVNDEGEVVTSSECPYCHRLFYAQCKVPWHAGMDCEEFQELQRSNGEKELESKFLELAKSEMWQICPKCSTYVQRSSGCEHMKCRCGCSFCYVCGKVWDYGHTCNESQST